MMWKRNKLVNHKNIILFLNYVEKNWKKNLSEYASPDWGYYIPFEMITQLKNDLNNFNIIMPTIPDDEFIKFKHKIHNKYWVINYKELKETIQRIKIDKFLE